MFEYLFPIFAFGVVITAIVFKGLLAAAEEARAERNGEAQPSFSTRSRAGGQNFMSSEEAAAQTKQE